MQNIKENEKWILITSRRRSADLIKKLNFSLVKSQTLLFIYHLSAEHKWRLTQKRIEIEYSRSFCCTSKGKRMRFKTDENSIQFLINSPSHYTKSVHHHKYFPTRFYLKMIAMHRASFACDASNKFYWIFLNENQSTKNSQRENSSMKICKNSSIKCFCKVRSGIPAVSSSFMNHWSLGKILARSSVSAKASSISCNLVWCSWKHSAIIEGFPLHKKMRKDFPRERERKFC